MSWVLGSVAIAAAACGGGAASKSGKTGSGTKLGKAVASGATAIALRDASDGKPITADWQFVRLIGVAANGDLLDYGEVQREVAVDHGRVNMPEGKPTTWADLAYTTATRTFVLLVDPERPASEIQKVVSSLDKVCWGFGVAVGSKLGVALPAPCPAGPIAADMDDFINLSVIVSPEKVRFEVSHLNEVASVERRGDVKAKLAEYRQSEFFKGKPCPQERPAQPDKSKETDDSDESGGTGTAMAFAMEDHGRCDVLMAFDDSAKAGDVIDFFDTAMSAGFTEPHWVRENQLPKIDLTPPKKKEPDPDTPAFRAANHAVEQAQKKVDDAKAAVLAMTKDTSKSAAQIKQAVEREKRAEDELKTAKKKRKALREKAKKKT